MLEKARHLLMDEAVRREVLPPFAQRLRARQVAVDEQVRYFGKRRVLRELFDGVAAVFEGVLRASEISRDKVEDARNALKEGDEIEVKIVSVDRKSRILSLSVKAIEIDDEKSAVHDHKSQDGADVSPGTIGDLIKAEMDKS